jgi:hypothetical protein
MSMVSCDKFAIREKTWTLSPESFIPSRPLQNFFPMIAMTSNRAPSEALLVHIFDVLLNCGEVVEEVEKCLKKHMGDGVQRGLRWSITGREEMEKLQSRLETHN